MPHPRWKLRTLFTFTTVITLYLGFVSYYRVPLKETLQLASLPILLLTIVYERRMPQWISLVIAATCLYILLTPQVD